MGPFIIVVAVIGMAIYTYFKARGAVSRSGSGGSSRSTGGSSDGWYYAKVSVVIYKNDDGTSRQEILSRCRKNDDIKLVRDKGNPHSKNDNAVKVCRANGEQIGFIAEQYADNVSRAFDEEHRRPLAIISDIYKREGTYGCSLKINFKKGDRV